jgi:hypothetical protein
MAEPRHQARQAGSRSPGQADHHPWRTGPDGVLLAQKSGLVMMVHGSSENGLVRFMVLAPKIPGRRAAMLRGSGTTEDIQAAKAAAESMAARVAMWA